MKIDLKRITDWDNSWPSRQAYLWWVMKKSEYIYLGQGRHRITFMAPHKRFVLKFPRNWHGIEVNQSEAKVWSKYLWRTTDGGVSFAPCRLYRDVILMMRTVTDLQGDTNGCERAKLKLGSGDYGDMPAWADNIDCKQVGRLYNGRVVAYDFGSNYYV